MNCQDAKDAKKKEGNTYNEIYLSTRPGTAKILCKLFVFLPLQLAGFVLD